MPLNVSMFSHFSTELEGKFESLQVEHSEVPEDMEEQRGNGQPEILCKSQALLLISCTGLTNS